MNLPSHIEYLLRRHDTVVVPRIGAFMAVNYKAKIDLDKGEILPPSRFISFNREITADDGLLVTSLCRRNGFSCERGEAVMLKEIYLLRQSLETEGEVAFGHLGCLTLDTDKRIGFIPRLDPCMAAEEMGMTAIPVFVKDTFKTDIPENSVIMPLQENYVADIPLKKVTQESSETVQTDNVNRKERDDNNYYIAINKTFARVAASFIIVLAVALSVLLPTLNRRGFDRPQMAALVPVEKIMPVMDNEPEIESAEENVAVIENALPPAASVQEQEHNPFWLIVATFKTRNEAEKYISSHADSPYTFTAVEGKKVCRVAVASSADRDQLRLKMNSKTMRDEFPEAWIWAAN